MKYNFKETEEAGKNPKEMVIEQHGHINTFTMVEMENDFVKFDKQLKEIDGNIALKEGVLQNLDHHHPFIKEMSEFDRYAVHMYQEAFSKLKAYKEAKVMVEAQYAEQKEMHADILTQLPELAVEESAPVAEKEVEAVPEETSNEEETNTTS